VASPFGVTGALINIQLFNPCLAGEASSTHHLSSSIPVAVVSGGVKLAN